MKCDKCGFELKTGAKFCNQCGTAIDLNEDMFLNQENEDIVVEDGFKKLKKNWNDKYTIVTLILVMIVAGITGLLVRNISNKDDDISYDVAHGNNDYSYEELDNIDYNKYNDNSNYGENQENSNLSSNEENYENYDDSNYENTIELENQNLQEYILPNSSTEYLTKAHLEGLTAEECRLARNEIYARHGRMFNDASLQAYFESFDWYYPTIPAEDFEESILNEYEVANRDLIVEYEMEQGYR